MKASALVRVLLMIDDASVGGGQQHVLALAENLDRKRYKVAVACEASGYLVDELRKRGIPLYPIAISNKPSLHSFFSCVNAVRQFGADIVHTHGGTAGVYGRTAARFIGGICIVHTYHGLHYLNTKPTPVSYLHKMIDRMLVPITDSLICVAQADYDLGIAKKVVYPATGVVIYNGIEIKKYQPHERNLTGGLERTTKNDIFVVGTIGRLHIQKGHHDLLIAAKEIVAKYPAAVFRIIGEGPLRKELEKQASELGLSGNVQFLGARADIPEQLAQMDIFVLPSLWEGLPIVLLEAMAAKKPIVATNVNGVVEIIEDGKEGILVPPKNPTALSDAIISLHRDSGRAQAFVEASHKKVCDRFSIDSMISNTQKVYERIV